MRAMRNLFQDSVRVNQATIAYFARYRLTVDKNLASVPLERASPKEQEVSKVVVRVGKEA